MVEEYLEIYDEVDEDQKSKCRLCATDEKNKYLINIFGKVGRKYALDIKIRKCLPIPIREDDGMPKGVCLDCINKLDVSCELVDSCLRAHHTFLSLMNHDPARAKSERFAMVEDEECEDQSITEDPALEELSDTVSTQHVEDFEMPVVIKDEPMDLGESEEEISDPIEKGPTTPTTWLDQPSQTADTGSKNIKIAETSAQDAVEPVAEEPSQSESMPPPTIGSISVRSTDTLLQSPAVPGTSSSSDIADETPAEVEQNDMENITIIQQSSIERNVIIKEEPPGSPSRSFSFAQPTSSEVPTPEGFTEDAAPVSTQSTFGVTETSDVSSVPHSPKGYPSMQMNGITKRPMMTAQRPAEELPVTLTPHHEEIIRYIYEQWSIVAQEMDRYNHHNGADNRGRPAPPTYFQGSRESTPQMKDFKAVDLERQRLHHKSDHHHSHPAP